MALVPVTVIRSRKRGFNAKTHDSVTFAISTEKSLAIPSVCKTDAGSNGLVNSHVVTEIGTDMYDLYCTETATEIAALDD